MYRMRKKSKALFLVPKTFQVIAIHNAFFVGSLSTSTTTLVAGSVFLQNVMEFTPKSPTQQCIGCEESPKHCFWYQKPTNLQQMLTTYNPIV